MASCQLETEERPLTLCDVVNIINGPAAWEDEWKQP